MARRGNFEDKDFENAWGEAFEDASVRPDPKVWGNIEKELAFQQLAVFKKKARFYQWTSAAAVFLVAILGINYLISLQDPLEPSAATSTAESTELNSQTQSPGPIRQGNNSTVSGLTSSEESNQTNFASTVDDRSLFEDPPVVVVDDNVVSVNRSMPLLSVTSIVDPIIEYLIEPNTDRELYKMPVSIIYVPPRNLKRDRPERFWAGVGMGSGSFDPNYQSGSSNLLASSLDLATAENYAVANSARIVNESPAVRESMRSGSTLDLGLNFGLRISKNWILESGVFYTQADAVTHTNLVVESPNVVEPIAASSEIRGVTQLNSIVGTERFIEYNYQDVNLDNQFQFASFPVKAGFIVIDSRINIIVNAGFATNLYLGNRLVDPNSEVANVTIGPGVSSPYREVSFAGLGGLQIGYAIFDQVELTLEPYMRQPITSLTKDNTAFVSAPSGYGINTGIRYRFN